MTAQHIHILDKQIAERIAAGEVIERPASVVKELIENAIDADARAISIEIREGGIALMRVSDNGSGMSRDDATLAVERFATSKISSDADLRAIKTLGFRGEALPSIAAMAQLEILTRARPERSEAESKDAQDVEGTRVRGESGNWNVEIVGAPIGTQVIAHNLFYNAPARRKFLKSPFRETELIQKTIVQYALAYPQIAFRLIVDGRETMNLAKAARPSTPLRSAQDAPLGLERIGAVWGRESAGEMIELNYTSVDLHVRGFVSRPSLARASREWQNFFVNGRPIRSGLLAVMLERPYAGRLPPGRHPLAIIHIEIDPQLVDVNVHPRKAEVRFYQERAIYGAVTQAVQDALREFPINYSSGATDWSFDQLPFTNNQLPIAREARALYLTSNWRALGQIHNTYLLAQTQDGMVIVDQHAAQEQIFFERLTSETRIQNSEFRIQIQVMPRESELIAAHLDTYRALGIDLEPFGANTFRVNALPEFTRMPANELLNALLAEHERYRALDGDALRDKLASKCACVCALKSGDALDLAQQQKLLDELIEIYSPATCPHGRPAFVAITLEELDRRFLRR
ncbi:MAG: DNA mismatch repair endonuclease MutL [Chloroflexi bacterium]|nr:DNA mismatch repair endonuclease MutL [Chloroflexota bacterium]